MPIFRKSEGLYGVQINTGPRSVLLRLQFSDERTEDFEVASLAGEKLGFRNPKPDIVRKRVLEGTDEANRKFGTTLHPCLARFAIDDWNDECPMLSRGSLVIVERLAGFGDEKYEGIS